jgi:hypothetical protein
MRDRRGTVQVLIASAAVAAAVAVGAGLFAGGGVASGDRPVAKANPVKLELRNGWDRWSADAPAPAALRDGKVVHLKGAMDRDSGSSPYPFRLAPEYRPSHEIRVLAQFFDIEVGELLIAPNGRVDVVPNNSNAAELTSLDGISFVR